MPNTIPFGGATQASNAQGAAPTTIPFGNASASPQQPQQAPQPSILDQVWGGLGNAANQIGQAAQSGVAQIGQGIQQAKPAGGGGLGGLVTGVGNILGGAANVIQSPLTPITQPTIGAGINAIGNQISNNPAVQKFSQTPAGKTTANVAGTVANYANAAGTVVAGAQAADAIPKTVQSIKDYVNPPPEVVAARAAADKAGQAANVQSHIDSVTQDWQSVAKEQGNAYNNIRKVLAKSPEAPQALAENGINPADNIQSGKYVTTDTAANLRDTAGSISQDFIRPSLEKIDASGTVPPKPAADFVAPAKSIAADFPGVTPDALEQINTAIDNKVAALDRANPDGLGLVAQHDNKITYSQNAGYNPVRADAENNAALANKAVGLALKDSVEKSIPADAPIGEANAALSRMYKGADYLDALNGKKAPVSLAQSAVKYGFKIGGAAAARSIFGGHLGDIITTFVGYKMGGIVDNWLENLTNAGRAEVLDNLQYSQPEAFAKLSEFLKTGGTAAKSAPK